MTPLERHLADRGRQLSEIQPTHSVSGTNPFCGDELTLSIRTDSSGSIEAASFQSRGCLISEASASYLCERVIGMNLTHAATITGEQFLADLGTPLSPIRRECALLPLRVLQRMF